MDYIVNQELEWVIADQEAAAKLLKEKSINNVSNQTLVPAGLGCSSDVTAVFRWAARIQNNQGIGRRMCELSDDQKSRLGGSGRALAQV